MRLIKGVASCLFIPACRATELDLKASSSANEGVKKSKLSLSKAVEKNSSAEQWPLMLSCT